MVNKSNKKYNFQINRNKTNLKPFKELTAE